MMNKKGPMLDAIRNKRGNSINLTITVEPEAGLMTGEPDKELQDKDQEQLGLAPEGEMDKSEMGNEPMMGELGDGDAPAEVPVMDDKKALMDEILMKKLGKNSLLNRAQKAKQA